MSQQTRKLKSGVDYVRFYPGAWRNGCFLLSLEQEALYLRICAFRWDTGQLVPVDRSRAAKMLRVQILKYRKLLNELIAEGLVVETADGIVVERAELEYENAARASRDAAATLERTSRAAHQGPQRQAGNNPVTGGVHLEATPHTTPTHTPHHTTPVAEEIVEANQCLEGMIKNKTKNKNSNSYPINLEPAAAQSADDLLEKQLLEACNGALDNPVNCMGLLNLQVPKMWLEKGADLEADVLPTLRAAGKKYHGKRVRDWSYFTGMIVDAKSRRERGLPAPSSSHDDQPIKSRALELLNATSGSASP